MTGKVTKIQNKKRKHGLLSYGFITDEDGNEYYFILADTMGLELGKKVSFKGGTNEKGRFATEVCPITE